MLASSRCPAPEGAREQQPVCSKMRVYDGENLEGQRPAPRATRSIATTPASTKAWTVCPPRFCQDHLRTFNHDTHGGRGQPGAPDVRAGAADPARAVPAETEQKYRVHQGAPGRALRRVHRQGDPDRLESYNEYGQNIFDRYVTYADYWIEDHEYRDHRHRPGVEPRLLNAELEKIEKPAGIANPKDFRNEIVNFVLRARQQRRQQPLWTLREDPHGDREEDVQNTEDLLPVISFNAKASADEAKKHEEFRQRMDGAGYTPGRCAAGGRVVYAFEAGRAAAPEQEPDASIIDRPAGGRKARQPENVSWRRYREEQIRDAGEARIELEVIRVGKGGKIHIPPEGPANPNFRPRAWRRATRCTRQTANTSRRQHRAARGRRWRAAARGSRDRARARTTSLSRSPRRSSRSIFEDLKLPNRPGAAPRLAECPYRTAGFTSDGSAVAAAIGPAACATRWPAAWRWASEAAAECASSEIATLRPGARSCRTTPIAARGLRKLVARLHLRAWIAFLYRSDRLAYRTASTPVPTARR